MTAEPLRRSGRGISLEYRAMRALRGLSVLLLAMTAISAAAPARAQQAAENGLPWPHRYDLAAGTLIAYEPQVEGWRQDHLEFRAAVSVLPAGTRDEQFGVIWGKARTAVDPVTREVALLDLVLDRSSFPTLPDQGAAYLDELRQQLAREAPRVPLDMLEASLAASGAVEAKPVEVRNDPPAIIVSQTPAILIPIAGDPVIKVIPGTWFERIVNTRAAILRELGHEDYLLHLYDGWVTARSLDGPWRVVEDVPPGAASVARGLAASGEVDLMDGGKARPALAAGLPAIHVATRPTELVVFKGQPDFQPIGTTDLLWAANTTADVLFDTGDNRFYILISGRWYRSAAATGPWSFVAADALPASFRQIPPSAPAGVVLAAVGGTPQAKEAVIEASIPRTATVPRQHGPVFDASYDGKPELRHIDGTSLDYVVNAPEPTIRVDDRRWYALRAGIWFTAPSDQGPWVVASEVPDTIYTIPASSPLHYVTYVRVYGSTPEVVYVGYTPGYLGSVVAPDGTVVYGTGYDYPPWIGASYYPAPATYGVQALPVYNPAVGWAYGAALGLTTAAMVDSWDSHDDHDNNYYYSSVDHGYPCCGSTNAHVYGAWGDTVTSGNEKHFVNSNGTYGQDYHGSYTDYRTGTTGDIQAGHSYDPNSGVSQGGYNRTFDTANGTQGDVQKSAAYDPKTGTTSYDASGSATNRYGDTAQAQRNSSFDAQTDTRSGEASGSATGQNGQSRQGSASGSYDRATGTGNYDANRSATGQGGSSVTRDTTASTGGGDNSAERETTVDNAHTGQTNTYERGGTNGQRYAGSDGKVYKNDGGGWQQHTGSGWQSASGDTSWADREQQARSQGADRYSGFSGGGWASRFGGGGDRFGGGGERRFGGGGFRRW
jgi:hypothetical protein